MSRDFIPSTDQDFLVWSANFDTKLTAAPTTIGLIAGDATAYAALHTAYASALTAASNPGTRTPVTIAAKVTAKTAAITKARALVKQAQAFSGTSNAERADFGMTVRDTLVTPINAPSSNPLVQLTANSGNLHAIKLRDSATPTTQQKPDGVTAAEVWVKVGGDAPTSVAQCTYQGDATRNPFTIAYDGADTGKMSYIITRWKTARGLIGPESPVLPATIAA